ncbi:MAG TPA: alkaline phosphatase family protein, partial [Candidatus Obscuribacterales bacterium]
MLLLDLFVIKSAKTLPERQRILAVLFFVVLLLNSLAAPPCRAQAAQASRPRLVLLLVADHFSYNYLSRYQDKLSSGGLRFLAEHGAVFTNCRLQNATTQNACGQAAISTGANPWLSGIVGDEWYYHRAKTVTAVEDESARLVGGNGPGSSLNRLMSTTIGDQMKLSTNGRSKVISISLRDSSALLLGGVLANYALFWDTRIGNFVTSSIYGTDLPGWVKAFNDQHYADRYFGKPWQRSLPETEYTASTRDDYPHEKILDGDGRQFPHVITGGARAAGEQFYKAFAMTPWANQMVGDLAREAIEREFLGQHPEPDLLAVSFSAGDFLNAAYG